MKNKLNIIPEAVIIFLFIFSILTACGPPDKLEYSTVEGSGSVYKVSENITILFNDPPNDTLIDNYLINLIYKTADDVANGRMPVHTKLDVCLYDFDRELLIDALKYAVSKNVHVRFVGDMNDTSPTAKVNSATYSGDPGYLDIAKALDANVNYAVSGNFRENFPTDTGFDPRTDGMTDYILINSSGIMHNKFVLIENADGKQVYTGSTNASDNDILRNNNNSLIIKNDAVFAVYKQQFEYMLSGTNPVDVTKTLIVDNIVFDISFAYPAKASNKTHTLIASGISSAAFNIYFMIFTFTHADISSAISGKTGLTRMGIFDESQKDVSGTQYYTLKAVSGITCRLDGNENSDPDNPLGGAKLHHKVMILDRGYSSAKVITGSSNWSASANDANDENVIIISSKSIAEIYYTEFQKRWAEAE